MGGGGLGGGAWAAGRAAPQRPTRTQTQTKVGGSRVTLAATHLGHLDVGLLRLGQHHHHGGGRVHPPHGLGLWDALHAVHAALAPQLAVHLVAVQADRGVAAATAVDTAGR